MTDDAARSGETGAEAPDEVTGVTEAGAPAEAAPSAPAGETSPARRPSRLRRLLVGFLILLSCLAVVVTALTLWTHYTVMNTDGYMNLVGPIGKDPQAIKNLSEYIGTQAVTATDLQQRVTDALPARAQFFAGPITAQVENFITKGAEKVLSTPKAYDVWLQVNRIGHEKVVALLRGKSTNAYVQGSDVKVNLIPLVSQVLVWADGKLPGGLSSRFSPPDIAPGTDPTAAIQQLANWSGKPLPSDFGQVTILTSDALGQAQTAVKWFDRLVWILPLLTLALIAVTIWLARRRRRTAIAIGIGAAIAIVLARVIIKRASLALIDSLGQGNGVHLAKDLVNASLGPLTTITIWIVVIAAVAAVIVWALGRRDVRNAAVGIGKRATGQTAEISVPGMPVTSWVARHVLSLRWAVLIIALILLALITWSWLGIVLIVLIVLLFQAVLSLVAGQWPFAGEEAGESAAG
jgi:hypothetical protein